MSNNNTQRKNIKLYARSICHAMECDFTVHKRFSDINWINHEIVHAEPRALFPWSDKKSVREFFDAANLNNIANAYDYVCANRDTEINWRAMCDIHYIICKNTFIPGGQFRTSAKILDISINGIQYHAPNYLTVPFEMHENIENRIQRIGADPLDTAIKTHAEMILLQPFEDFNKRTARMVMNWILIQNNFTPIIFNNKSDKIAYRNAIGAYAAGATKVYDEFMLNVMERTQKSLLRVIKKSHRR